MERLSNTRLQSSLVWGADPAEGLVPELDFLPLPVTGPVPKPWRALVDVLHLNDYYARIVHYVLRPVETERRAGRRRVSVLGQAVFETDPNGFVKAYLWTWRQGAFACWALPGDQVSVGNTPHAWTWLELFRQGFAAELAARRRCNRDDLEAYSRWVFRRFRCKLARECDLRHMRELVSAALAHDPLALQVARRIRLACRRPPAATLREYNHAIAHLAAFRTLQKEAPNLVPLYALHAYALDAVDSSQPAQQLKLYLMRRAGLRQSTWALVHGMRPRWMLLVEHFYEGSVAKASIDLLQLIQELGCRRAPPRWYLWNVLQMFGHHGLRIDDYAEHYAGRGRAMRRLTALIEAADAAQLAEMRARLYEVLAWIVDEDAHELRGISRAGWKWFVRRAEEWRHHQDRRAAAVPGAWPVPFEELREGAYTVRMLRTHEELLREARAMNHCVDRYAQRCAGGGHLILSIRRDGRARPIATAHLRRDRGHWRLVHVVGAANTVARPAGVRLAQHVNARLNYARWGVAPATPNVIDEPAAPRTGNHLHAAADDTILEQGEPT